VAKVPADGRAAKAGLKPGDVIVGIDDNNIRHAGHLYRYIDRTGMSYRLRIVRDGVPGWIRMVR
jgi:S1-C subfamily serine protease